MSGAQVRASETEEVNGKKIWMEYSPMQGFVNGLSGRPPDFFLVMLVASLRAEIDDAWSFRPSLLSEDGLR